MISDAVQILIDEFDGLAPILTYEEIVTIRDRFDGRLNTLKDEQKATFKQRYESERLALEERFKTEALSVGVDMFPSGGKRVKLPPKYQDPDKPENTWSGRGKRPEWLSNAVANGRPLESMRIQTVTPVPSDDIPF